MPAYHVESSTIINADSKAVHKGLDDFNVWPVWSPWLYTEPQAKLEYKGTPGEPGHGYSWEGKLTGAGSMELTENNPESMKMDLVFLKPFKSTAKIRFDIEEKSDHETKVTWHMDSSMPFFLFFMTGNIKNMIRKDYERGLKMLKEYIETGSINSQTDAHGIVPIEAKTCIGIRTDSNMAELGDSMGVTLPALYQHAQSNNLAMIGPPLTIYNKVDLKNSRCSYTAALPVDSLQSDYRAEFDSQVITCENVAAGNALKFVHRGSYEHLGNAWATAYAHQRDQKLKLSKKQAPFELYVSDPENTAPKDILTEIYLPLK